ncbi:hypothetical protein M2G23_09615 [Vibrio vulnificus]|uniref:hypothetical protein n=1 Tax=Vibrio vulnificus TaxID=672 RepID=UPI001A230F2A|nr:hypothetical protein [Vibrio vulnificus]ELK8602542.1 hypothetical protein [Vibrio vulnificus]MCG6290825.1 hypothetical protein [Vibrio vulnificus]MCU8546097.1 hypothetical protein [Vibrio vulnificus]MCU8577616.1 hypothetical protein [Vibrio vulnificus]HAS8264140.1 hypothetical protein [Vibrio vulnificus]
MKDKIEISQLAVSYIDHFMEEKLAEMKENLNRIRDNTTLQIFLEEQKVIVLCFAIIERSVAAENREKFETLKINIWRWRD